VTLVKEFICVKPTVGKKINALKKNLLIIFMGGFKHEVQQR
jgi:hypothetical protein